MVLYWSVGPLRAVVVFQAVHKLYVSATMPLKVIAGIWPFNLQVPGISMQASYWALKSTNSSLLFA